MRLNISFWQGIRVATAAALVLCLASACKPSAPPAAAPKPVPAKPAPMAAGTNLTTVAYVSVFDDLMPPKGRDPFFPNSHRRDPVPVIPRNETPQSVAGELQLKGVIGSPGHRTALINSAILEVGEQDTVRVPSGRVKVKCLEIGEDYAVVRVEGEAQPKRLVLNKKGF